MITLAIDTSTKVLAVAVIQDGHLIGSCNYTEQMRHAKNIVVIVEQVMHEAGVAAHDITHLACGVGPGSYTGLRIGQAFIKGFSVARDLPVIPFSSMALLGHVLREEHARIAVVLDARRDKYYCAIFERADSGGIRACISDQLCDEKRLADLLREYTVDGITGDALGRHAHSIESLVGPAVFFYPEEHWVAHAEHMSALVETLPVDGVAAGALIPNYMRISEAEEKAAHKEEV